MKRPRLRSVQTNQRGFSLTEILIAVPLATIITVVLISTLFANYTDSLAESARSNLRAAGQSLLINLQDELLFTIAYGEQLDANLTDDHAPTGGWTHATTPQTLIINEIALDSTRRDDTRHIIRQRFSNCESSAITANPLAINNVIYFVADNPNSDYDTLYKRTVTPTYDLCSIDLNTGDPCTPTTTDCRGNAKQTSCPLASVGTGSCITADSALTENVVDIQIRYFAEDNIETSFPSAADKVEITLTLGDKVYGKAVETEIKHTIRKIN